MFDESQRLNKRVNASSLLKVYTLASIVSIIIILTLSDIGFRAINTKQHIKEAEHDAVGISQAIYKTDQNLLVTSDLNGESILSVDQNNFDKLDKSMNNFLTPLDIIKIKIFSNDGRIIYSTDHAIIGQTDAHNDKLIRALNGEIVSELEKKDEVWDIAGEKKFDIDLVETYLPVRDEKDNIIGSFELYLDISRYRAESKEAVRLEMIVITSILFITFGFLFLLMKKGTNELSLRESIIQENEKHFRSVVETANDAFVSINSNGEIVLWNQSAINIFGYSSDEAIGKPVTIIMPKEFHDDHNMGISRILAGGKPKIIDTMVEVTALNKNGSKFPIELSLSRWETERGAFFTAVIRDITERKKIEDKIKALSLTDELTGLYNRRGFFNLSEQQLKLAKRGSKKVYMLYLDLDNFKEINDTFGHSEGDTVLKDIAMILKSSYRESDVIGRLGGDEFVVFPIGSDDETIKIVVDRLYKNIDIFNRKSNKSYKLSVSVGVASYDPIAPCSLDELITKADHLMYENKKNKQDKNPKPQLSHSSQDNS
jgi:diguanylate cyclase (GGDEF)-like protein/PAS domain S-box-containing protein